MPTSRTKPGARAANKQLGLNEQLGLYDIPSEVPPHEQFLPVHDKPTALDAIFKDADVKHGLTLFAAHEQRQLDLWQKGGKFYLHCLARGKKVLAKPEEVIRQLCLKRLLDMDYSLEQLALEVPVKMGSTVHSKAADLVIYREEALRLTPYIIVELKRPQRRDGLDQLETYMNATGAPFGWWLNGKEQIVRYREDPNLFESLDRLPNAGETIDDVRVPRKKRDLKPLVNLRELVELLEERVLANAGVSAFDEVFKLIFAKLYDEHTTGEDEPVRFRRGSETPEELSRRIEGLFVRATRHPGWNEIFDPAEKIQLTPQALAPCVSELEPYRFFGSDLDVLDAAFEHLVNPEQKGDKGQYFTPRHVVRMCVAMLNPKEDERCLDPACGPCGFMIHTLKHVAESPVFKRKWGHEAEAKRREYAQNFLYAIDFDHKLAKVAKVMMLIMGDGKTHVFRVNSLDPREWKTHPHRVGDFIRDGDFDVVMTNPPFAGEITQAEVLGGYDLAYKGDPTRHKRANKVERDVLFIERCLRFLRPGGRMAIVLPQGIFNNATEQFIRDYVMQHARILAVVGLHGNMFKPFTGTKTSVLFLQKWESQEQRIAAGDYRIFFATSHRPGKDNSGEYIWLDQQTGQRVRDTAGKKVGEDIQLDHDLKDITEAFKAFAKEEGLDFFA
jgi:type I restriction enzyme M protein